MTYKKKTYAINSNGNIIAIRSYSRLNLKDLFIFPCFDAIWKNENGTMEIYQRTNIPIPSPSYDSRNSPFNSYICYSRYY